MNFKELIAILASLLLVTPVFLTQVTLQETLAQVNEPDVYVGVDMAYGGSGPTAVAAAQALIDKVGGYTNLFIVGTTGLSYNAGYLGTIFQYAYDRGMSFMSFVPSGFSYMPPDFNYTYYNITLPPETTPWGSNNATRWFDYANANWTDHLLGFLAPSEDEPAGKMLDNASNRIVRITDEPVTPSNYSRIYHVENIDEAAKAFVSNYTSMVNTERNSRTLANQSYPLFTCDYGLYWFDYQAGQDGVFAEFAYNYDRNLNMALNRGAAQVQNKQWGVIIVYNNSAQLPPYLESGSDLYIDMVAAYDAGAKYIVIFDSNPSYSADILQPEHLQALQSFWTYIHNNPRKSTPISGRTAFVLPANYGCGFRGENDTIWGLWNPQDFTYGDTVNRAIGNLLRQYGNKLDIIYDDETHYSARYYGYQNVIYWDAPSVQPTPTPSPTPSPAPSPTPTPTATPTATPTLAPNTSTNASATPSPTLDPTQLPTSAPTPYPKDNSNSGYIVVGVAVGVLMGFLVVALLVRRWLAQPLD
jgi:hypothetical protein